MMFLLFPTPCFLAYGMLFIKPEAESTGPDNDESDPVLLFVNDEDKAGTEIGVGGRLAYASGVDSAAGLKVHNEEEEEGR